MLAAQFGYFIYYVIQDFKKIPEEEVAQPVVKDTVNAPAVKTIENKPTKPKIAASEVHSKTPDTESKNKEHTTSKQKDTYIYDGWKWDMVELNTADSAALDGLPGIGPYYARQILQYRERLWGRYHDIHQLMEIRGIDTTLFSKIRDRIYIAPESIILTDLYSVSTDSLASHPYIGSYLSRGIDRYRSITPKEEFSIESLISNRIITPEQLQRISLYFK